MSVLPILKLNNICSRYDVTK